ncbi:uncharacterized protein LOC113671797 [Pocillopora damicornis]|uniref:uncharacterized protein LOC113671797 n=1 Tax=Pocillopora damicornis TaxID=46731 RepID=UPI000F55154B|nr:uncharacterized protein LOC113671797 [Pocillopora damicornis]
MLDVKFVFILILVLQVKGDCLTGKCEKIHFNVQQHAKQDQELVSHVFHRSVTSNPAQCYLWCINDCRCLSINYKVKNETKYCELNKHSHLTSKNSLKNILGSIYYILLREYSTKGHNNIVPCTGDVNCGNGCCRNSPCLNGGTCTEVCESTSVRYRCSCPLPFVGKHCESWLRRSCQEYKLAGFRWSRLFTLIDDSHQTFRVFCDFDSEPRFAWNLIESFNLSSKDLFQKNVTFYDDYQAISGDDPNWQAYLIKRPNLLWLRNHSTHWRAICRYNTDGTVYTDYLRASLEHFDIISDIPSNDVPKCRPFEYVNIRGNKCRNCTDCDFFGLYSKVNPKFRCTSSSNATTQFWIGGTL